MRTCIDIDDRLMRQAMRCTGATTKKAAVAAGLRLLVDTCSQISIRGLRGKVRWNRERNRSSKAQQDAVMARRDALGELMEGVAAMKSHREGKITLRSYTVEVARPLTVDLKLVRDITR